ncbi:heat shock 70 kDa protein 12A-like isoform X2 [Argopecten irradians]|uniref:heat shock 70 kDa protein 12A-like isoform X2 n=1 Tax=Argopecten irradians TaxID=31199 RepID=UPI00372038DF
MGLHRQTTHKGGSREGTTVDISWHGHGGLLKRLFSSKGRTLGGDNITEEILKFLEQIYGEKCMLKVKEDTDEYERLVRAIQTQLYRHSTDSGKNLVMKGDLPFEFSTQDNIDVSRFQDSVNINKGRLMIRNEQWFQLFENTTTAIEANIERVLQDNRLQNVEFLLMVGEFSQCKLITSAIRKKFPKMKCIVPDNPSFAVVSGAAYFGLQWALKLAQHKSKSKYTYGIQDWPKFDKTKHPLDKLVVIDGVPRCKDVFLKYIEQGHDIPKNRRVSLMWTPFTTDSSDTIDCTVYVSSESDPMFTDDDGCTVLGVLHTPFTVDSRKERERIEQTIIFCPTSITLQAKNLSTGETCETQIEYM